MSREVDALFPLSSRECWVAGAEVAQCWVTESAKSESPSLDFWEPPPWT